MKDFARPRYARFFVLPALAVTIGWLAWTQVFAESSGEADSHSRSTITLDTQQLADAIRIENERHNAAVSRLEVARDDLKNAGANPDVIEQLIEAANRDHAARVKQLEAWRQARSARSDDRASRTRSIINSELKDIAKAIGSLNQSYRIAPISRPGAETGGSRFVDYQDKADRRNDSPDDDSADSASASQPEQQDDARKPLRKALQGEVPQRSRGANDSATSDQDSQTAGEKLRNGRLERRLEALTKQLEEIQRQLSEIRSSAK